MDPSTSLGLATGYLADRLSGDPRHGHPVAAFGTAATAAERLLWADDRRHGLVYTALLVGGAVGLGVVADRATTGSSCRRTLLTAVVTWTVLGGRSLEKEGEAMHVLLQAASRPAHGRPGVPRSDDTQDVRDLTAARQRLSHLCSRDATHLDADDLARAVVESLAENTSDAVTAPLFWGAVAGLPGLLGYRAANTLDAMVGYRSPRYEKFGWASARLDDVLNYLPARVNALMTVAVAPLLAGPPDSAATGNPRGRRGSALRAWRRDARAHPSPNAGPVEATAAGALGVRLGGTNSYEGAAENRGTLGDGRPPSIDDIPRAVRLTRLVGAASLAAAVLISMVAPRTGTRSAR